MRIIYIYIHIMNHYDIIYNKDKIEVFEITYLLVKLN